VIPFNYSNYKKVGPPTREIYFPFQKTKGMKKTFSVKIGKGKERVSFFLKERRHLASLETFNQSILPEKKELKNFFLDEKRHH